MCSEGEFLMTAKSRRFVSAENERGKGPMISLSPTSKVSRLERLPKLAGSFPRKKLLVRFSRRNDVRVQISSGMTPPMRFLCRYRIFSLGSPSRAWGVRWPEKSFSASCRRSNDAHPTARDDKALPENLLRDTLRSLA